VLGSNWGNNRATVSVTATKTGTHYVVASAYGDGVGGRFSLFLGVLERLPGTGQFAGTVRKRADNAAVTDAMVQVWSGGKLRAMGWTGSNGSYQLSGLAAGVYELRVVCPGFVAQAISDLVVLEHQTTTANFLLDSQNGGVVLTGRVTGATGLPLSGAAIWVAFGNLPLTGTTSDANGDYAVPLGAGIYAVTVSASGYAKSSRVLTVNAATATQNFQLAALPATPSQQNVTRSPTVTYTSGPMGSSLKVFNGTQFVSIPVNTMLPTDRMTIVLTHGWINPLLPGPNGIDDWPTTMAANLRTNGITPAIGNIVAWDWRTAATGISPPQVLTPGQGAALGTNLLAALGANYSQPIHFYGHSLGTMVNAAAVNFLHGERVPSTQADVSPIPWTNSEPFIHVTLFDEAAEATDNPIVFLGQIFDGISVSQNLSPSLLAADNNTSLSWSPPLPLHLTWADNYVGAFGFYHRNAVNALLSQALFRDPLSLGHSYPQQWYRQSIADPTHASNPLGFQWSYENDQRNGLPFSNIPPPGLNDAYYQSSPSDQLELSPIPFGLGPVAASPLGVLAGTVVQGVDGTVQFVGDVVTEVRDVAQSAVQLTAQGFNYVGNAALQGEQSLVNLYNSAVLRLRLHTTPTSGLMAIRRGPQPQDAGGDSGSPPMAWLPIQFPANATAMAFDFTVEGDPSNDVLVCGIGTNNLFSLEAKYIPTNAMSASRLIDVSAWVGTTNELFFGFLGGTSTNATLTIENIRFYSLAQPRLDIAVSGNATLLSWSLTAGGYVIETTPTLASPTWETVTNAPVISADRYVLTNSWSDQSRFFRLRQQ
jgi:hypothetical protein